jgi:flagellum-specific peptidoglycan hydrolase FlgJ
LLKAGYATDPSYVDKLLSLIDQHKLLALHLESK